MDIYETVISNEIVNFYYKLQTTKVKLTTD